MREGTGRQPFVLNALKLAGLTKKDVTLVPLRAADFPDAVRSGQVDVAVLNEPHFSRYLADYADRGASALPNAEHDRLPRGLTYLYASGEALDRSGQGGRDPRFRRALDRRQQAGRKANPEAWVDAYYVKRQNLKAADGRAIVEVRRRRSPSRCCKT